jgi:hypothetical protein
VDESETVEVRRRRRWPLILVGLLLLLLLGLLILWLMRFSIAADYIDRELKRRGVQATYEVKRIGFGRQRLENLVIGDPRRPDLTARWVEVRLGWSWGGPAVTLITARGVRLHGRISGGRVTLGQVDRLLPPPTGAPFRLPDQNIDLADSAIVLDTPAGRLALALSGRGNLSNGFRGHMSALSRGLRLGDCLVAAPQATVSVAVDRHRPTFIGPATLASLRCGRTVDVERPRMDINMTLAEAFDSWRGWGRLAAGRMRVGPNVLAGMAGRLTFTGDLAETRGALDIASARAAIASFRAAATRVSGDYSIALRSGHFTLEGEAAMQGFVLAGGQLRPVLAGLRGAGGTPVAPVGRALADALQRAATGGAEVRAALSVFNRDGAGEARFERLAFSARSGARLAVGQGSGFTYSWPGGGIRTDGEFVLSGGGLPSARFTLRQARPGGPIEGVGRVSPIAAAGSRLALGEVRFTAGSGGTRIETQATLDGPFSGGRVIGLTLPVRGRFGGGGFAFGESCGPASFQRLEIENLVVGPTRLPLCPSGRALVWKAPGGGVQGGAEILAPRFAGRLGASPIAIAADRLRFALAGPAFTATGVEVELGRAGAVHELKTAELSGRFRAGGAEGRYSGLSGQVANVPILFGQGSGRWQLLRGDLLLEGPVTVADEREPPRFLPLVSPDFRLTLAENRIRATGWMHHPESNSRITHATIDHDLRSGAGSALLDVPGIRFALDGLQPEDITPLTIGVIALVDGTLTGRGQIAWRSGETTSTGTFSTKDMDLAAAFGPVEGLTTTVEFADLLGLVSEPGQVAHIDLIRAGIDIEDGTVRYQLRPNSHVQIEGGEWPYAGAQLRLRPTLLDFSQPSIKYLTFEVVGLDAEAFTRKLEIGSVSLTGIFDGVIPVRIDSTGAHIVGGKLRARPGGGMLSYTGVVSEASLGTYGQIAFDALRSLRYTAMYIQLDGALAGEFLSRIQMDGVSLEGRRHWLIRRLAGLPFRFNIAIRGPLRAVIATARATSDPSLLIQPVLPEALQGLETTVRRIDKEESETVR